LVTTLLIAVVGPTSRAAADTVTAKVAAGSSPFVVAINPVTDKIYVGNLSGNMTVIDGATNTTTAIPLAAGTSQS
jgi:DNA-binding beta-propeller fold protein YncE